MKNKEDFGGYDRNLFIERLGVNALEARLLQTFRIVPHFFRNDKTPNIDGWFELCEKPAEQNGKTLPVSRFLVQIKATEKSGKNDSYQCDMKVLNSVLETVSFDPVLLFVIFIRGNQEHQIYWKHLSDEYCLMKKSNRKSVRITFSDEDKLTDMDKWIERLSALMGEHVEALYQKFDRPYILFPKNPELVQQISEASDLLNESFLRRFGFVKKAFFPNAWKLGITYLQDSGEFKFDVFEARRKQGGNIIRRFYDCNEASIYRSKGWNISLVSAVNSFIKAYVSRFFNDLEIPRQVPFLPNMALQELLFKELDNVEFENRPAHLQEGSVIRYGLPLETLSLDEYEQLKTDGKTTLLADQCLNELRRRGISVVERVWKKNLSSTVIGFHTVPIDKSFFANSWQLDVGEELKTADTMPQIGQDVIDRENRELFCRFSHEFFRDSCTRLSVDGTDFYQEVGQKYENEFLQSLSENLKHVECSWYRIWRIVLHNVVRREFPPEVYKSYEKAPFIIDIFSRN